MPFPSKVSPAEAGFEPKARLPSSASSASKAESSGRARDEVPGQEPVFVSSFIYAKNRSGGIIGCGLQMRSTQLCQLSEPLRISISTRKK